MSENSKNYQNAHNDAQKDVPEDGIKKISAAINTAKEVKKRNRRKTRRRAVQTVTACLAVMVIAIPNISVEAAEAMSGIPLIGKLCSVVTFRDYHYSSERFNADVQIPEIIDSSRAENKSADLRKTDAPRINSEMKKIAEKLIEEFKNEAESGADGYSSLYVNYEILHTTDEYFTLKLITFQGGGSGYEQDYYYTIDIESGKELKLSDMFEPGSDYITPISENIKEQMRSKMDDEASGATYWVDIREDDPIYEWSFREIKANQPFYVNADGNLVIAFGEGDVAPMYMGTQEFVIPKYVTDNIE